MCGALLESIASPWRKEDVVTSDEGTGIQVDGCMVVEINGHFGKLVLLGSRTSNKSINQFFKLSGAKSRRELKRRTQEGLGDGERGESIGGSHCNDC